MKIFDATGDSYGARVDSHNRLWTDALTVTEALNSTLEGSAYNINTGTITLTSGSESGVLYLLNDSDEIFVAATLIYIMGASTGGSGNILVDVKRNPTAGTLISGGTAISPVNRDFGSANTLDGTVLKGAEGDTVTDGENVVQSIFTGVGRYVLPVDLILRSGNSIAIAVTPQSGNTSMASQWAIVGYFKSAEE